MSTSLSIYGDSVRVTGKGRAHQIEIEIEGVDVDEIITSVGYKELLKEMDRAEVLEFFDVEEAE